MRRACGRTPWGATAKLVAGLLLGSGLLGPWQKVDAQAFDSTAMPSLELLAMEAGRASRRHPIRVHPCTRRPSRATLGGDG